MGCLCFFFLPFPCCCFLCQKEDWCTSPDVCRRRSPGSRTRNRGEAEAGLLSSEEEEEETISCTVLQRIIK